MMNPILRIDLHFVNAFLITSGEGFILVDTGISDVWPQLEKELLRQGCLPNKLQLVILTHGDKDHSGNGYILQHKYGAKIAMHQGDLSMVKTGISPLRRGTNLAGKFSIWFDTRIKSDFTCFTPDIFLQDDQALLSYGLAAKIIHTPGHTKGSICVLTDSGELIVGDTFTNRKKPQPASIIENENDLQESLFKLKNTQARIIYPGHGKPFTFKEVKK